METLEKICDRVRAQFPASVEILPNPAPSAQHSLLVTDHRQAAAIAQFLRDDETLRLDYCSNVTGIDWPDKDAVTITKTKQPNPEGGPARIVETRTTRHEPGCLEVVYHLYSMALKTTAPVIIRMRTANRTSNVTLPSLTPVWRSCEFQEREIYDLYGIIFAGHPDLRRILMWDEFKHHPMRKDYVPSDDYEWEPTPHGEVLERAKTHYPVAAPTATGANKN